MGIKTSFKPIMLPSLTLKNLPTTWGLRRLPVRPEMKDLNSEKPPHHMGIKTT